MEPNSPPKEENKEKESSDLKDNKDLSNEKEKEKEKEKQEPSEEEYHLKEDSLEKSNDSYSNKNKNNIQRRNSETDLDKIIAGKEEDQLDSNLNIDYKEDIRKTEVDKSIFPNFNFGNIISGFDLRRTIMTRFIKNI